MKVSQRPYWVINPLSSMMDSMEDTHSMNGFRQADNIDIDTGEGTVIMHKKSREDYIYDKMLFHNFTRLQAVAHANINYRKRMNLPAPDPENVPDGWTRLEMPGYEQKATEVTNAPARGVGVFALEAIKEDDFIFEYLGERISTQESNVREAQYLAQGIAHMYFMTIFNSGSDGEPHGFPEGLIVDSTDPTFANESRNLNHSCDPNALAYTVPNSDSDIARILIHATRDIDEKTEITIDYNLGEVLVDGLGQHCLCGAKDCIKQI